MQAIMSLLVTAFPWLPYYPLVGTDGGTCNGVILAHLTRHAHCPALPAQQRERAADGGTEHRLPNAMVTDAQYKLHEKSDFLIKLRDVSTLPKRGVPSRDG